MKSLKLYISLLLLGMAFAPAIQAAQTDTIDVAEFGIKPYTYENQTQRLQEALRACRVRGAKVLKFTAGRYDLWPEGAVHRELFVSNTSTEQECPDKTKTIGVWMENMQNLTIDGGDATLMFHGKMTMVAMMNCRNITLRNLHFDFERPAGSEIIYSKVEDGKVEVTFHRDTRYEVANGRINLIGEGWRSNRNHCIKFNKQSDRFTYSGDWNVLANCDATEVQPGVVQFATPTDFRPQPGDVLTVRDIIRDQVGMLICQSENVTLNDVYVHYMHGLGIVSQYSHNVTMDHVECCPRKGSGRVLASSADFMHFSGCSGKVIVTRCKFSGAHDDPINVHGTNLRAVEKLGENTLKMRFMHGQSYGFQAYHVGDTVAFVDASRMERFAYARVTGVSMINPRVQEVTFDRPVPRQMQINHDCVENMTCTPQVEITNNYFTHTSTRGTLITTPRKVVVANNVYENTGMSAILIEGDAEGWYESGPVNDVLIENNTFKGCAYNGGPGGAVIALHPSNTIIDASRPVHRNVRIVGNTFCTFGNALLYAKSTQGLVFKNNNVTYTDNVKQNPATLFILNGCKDVKIANNKYPMMLQESQFSFENMKKKH
ncbi:MAG: right-handed parallel beta-helix repeat-containing protein [Muribaculaceae bacterium]